MLPTLFPVHLFTIKKVKSRPWNTSNTWLKFSKTKGIFFRINCGISGQQYREHQLCYGYKFRRWVSYAKDKNNVRTFEQKVIQRQFVLYGQIHTVICLWYGLPFIVDQKWKNTISKLMKVDERILIVELARTRSKGQKETKIWIEKDPLNQAQN